MPKRTTLFMSVQILPLQTENPDTQQEEDGKELVFVDPVTGEEIHYPMGKDLAEMMGKKLRMSNRALAASLEEEARRVQARQMIAGANGAAPTQADIDKLLREQQKGDGH